MPLGELVFALFVLTVLATFLALAVAVALDQEPPHGSAL